MLKDDNQNFWQLACIQGSSLGVPGFLIGRILAAQYGVGTALTSLCIGNFILWVIALALFSMTYESKGKAKHAIQNVMEYLGKNAAIAAAALLFVAFLSWFSIQTISQTKTIDSILENLPRWSSTYSIRMGVLSAFITTFVVMGGIRTIKWVCTIAFPLMSIYIVYVVLSNFDLIKNFKMTWQPSLFAIVAAISVVLPGVINIPTFFRHARSRADGILGLTLMTIFVIAFEFGSIWFQFSSQHAQVFTPYNPAAGWTLDLLLALLFIALSTFCVNLVNVYFASAAIEMINPKFADARGYAVIGLLGALVYGLFQVDVYLINIENLTNSLIASLGAMLLLALLVQLVVRHRPRRLEKSMSSLCWLVGIITSIVYQVRDPSNPSAALLAGIAASVFTFLLVIFVEESLWSGQNLSKPRKSS